MRHKKLLAMLLSAAMVMTSFTVPVMADEIVESVEVVDEAEDAIIEEIDETAVEDENVVLTDDAAEELAGGTVEEEIPEEDYTIKSSDLYYQVTTYDDLYNAIADVNANATKTKNKQVVIDVERTSPALAKDNIFKISANEITINAGVDLVINSSSGGINFQLPRKDDNELIIKSASLTIAEGAKLTLNGFNAEINIINNGTLVTNGGDISPVSGPALVNNGVANITGTNFKVNNYLKAVDAITPSDIVVNAGTMTCNGVTTRIPSDNPFKAPEGDAKVTVFGIKNTGNLVMQDDNSGNSCKDDTTASMPTNTTYYALGNIGESAKVEIRNNYNEDVLNDAGTLTVGEEDTEADNYYSSEDIDTTVSSIRTMNNGLVIIHDAKVTYIYTYNDSVTATDTEGRVSVVGNYAKVGEIFTRDASRLQITNGYVGENYDSDYYYGDGYGYAKGSPFLDPSGYLPVKVVKLTDDKSEFGIDTDASKYVFNNPAATSLTRVKDGNTEYAYAILNGVPLFGDEKMGGTATGIKITDISNLAELKAFAAEGGYGRLVMTFDVNEVVTFTAEEFVLLESNGSYNLRFKDAGALVVADTVKNGEIYEEIIANNTVTPLTNNGVLKFAAKVTLNQGKNADNSDKEGGSAIVNNGTLDITSKYRYYDASEKRVYPRTLSASYDAYAKKSAVITNSATGILNIEKDKNYSANITVNANANSTTGISNAGSATLGNGVTVNARKTSSLASTGIYNAGTLEIAGANVTADLAGYPSEASCRDGWAIVYEGDKLPIITAGNIKGSRYTTIPTLSENTLFDNLANRVYGSAIAAFDGTNYSIGSYLYGPEKVQMDSMAAGYIANGQIPYTTSVDPDYDYLLMERGEIVQNSNLYSKSTPNNTFGCTVDSLWDITANNTLVTIGMTKKKDIDADAYPGNETEVSTTTAGSTDGMSILTFKNKITGAQDSVVIEITESREKLVGDSYQVKLAHPVETVNAYMRYTQVAIDWRLKTSALTGKEYDPDDAFVPKQVIITGATKEETELFNNYFDIYDFGYGYGTNNNTYQDTYQDSTTNTKEWCFFLKAKTDNPGVAEVTKLLQDEIKSLDNLNVTLLVGNKASEKTFAIDAGKLSIKVDYKKPKIKFSAVTVNSAFNTNSSYYLNGGSEHYPAKITSAYLRKLAGLGNNDPNIDDVRFNGTYAAEDFDISYSAYYGPQITYIGPAKNKSVKLPISVKLDGYVGYFESTLPVNIKATFPKVSLTTKKVVIPENAGDYYNIPIGLSAKTAEALGTVASVEVVGNDDFKVICENGINSLTDEANAIFAKNGKISGYKTIDGGTNGNFFLQPQKTVTKNTKVNLRVTFNGTKAKGGKTYAQTLAVTVSPVKLNKFSFKGDSKKSQALKVVLSENKAVDFEKSTDTATIMLAMNPSNYKDGYITVSSNDSKLEIVSINRMQKSFVVKAGPALTGKDKKATVYVNWYSANNTQLGKKDTPVTVNIRSVADIKGVKIADVKLNIAKAKPKNWDTLCDKYFDSNDDTLAWHTAWIKLYGQKLKVTNPEKYEFKCDGDKLANVYKMVDGDLFDIVEMNNALYVVPDGVAISSGKIVPGGEYSVSVPFVGTADATFKVTVNTVKSVKAALNPNTPAEISGITDYAHTQLLKLQTTNPWYGVGIKTVTIADQNSPFELINEYYETLNSYSYYKVVNRTAADNVYGFRLGYKGSKMPTKLAKSYKVKLNVEYTNGAKGTVTIPVKIK